MKSRCRRSVRADNCPHAPTSAAQWPIDWAENPHRNAGRGVLQMSTGWCCLTDGFRAPPSSLIFHPLVLSALGEVVTAPANVAVSPRSPWGFTSCATKLGYQVCARFGLFHSPENFVLYHYEMTFFIPCRSPCSEVCFVWFQHKQPPSLLSVAVLTTILNSLLVAFPFAQHPIIF